MTSCRTGSIIAAELCRGVEKKSRRPRRLSGSGILGYCGGPGAICQSGLFVYLTEVTVCNFAKDCLTEEIRPLILGVAQKASVAEWESGGYTRHGGLVP